MPVSIKRSLSAFFTVKKINTSSREIYSKKQ